MSITSVCNDSGWLSLDCAKAVAGVYKPPKVVSLASATAGCNVEEPPPASPAPEPPIIDTDIKNPPAKYAGMCTKPDLASLDLSNKMVLISGPGGTNKTPNTTPLGARTNQLTINVATTYGYDNTNKLQQGTQYGWTTQQAKMIQQFVQKMMPVIRRIYGPPSVSASITIVKNEYTTAYSIFLPTLDEIHMGPFNNTWASLNPRLLTHEIIHAYRNDRILSASGTNWDYDPTLSGFEEGFAEGLAFIALTKFNELNPNFFGAEKAQVGGIYSSTVWPEYDYQNNAALATTDFWTNSNTGIASTRYKMAAAAFEKIYQQYPGFFWAFNEAYYAKLNSNQTLRPTRSMVLDLVAQVAPYIEGQPAKQWLDQQTIFKCQPMTGPKLFMKTWPVTFSEYRAWGHLSRTLSAYVYHTFKSLGYLTDYAYNPTDTPSLPYNNSIYSTTFPSDAWTYISFHKLPGQAEVTYHQSVCKPDKKPASPITFTSRFFAKDKKKGIVPSTAYKFFQVRNKTGLPPCGKKGSGNHAYCSDKTVIPAKRNGLFSLKVTANNSTVNPTFSVSETTYFLGGKKAVNPEKYNNSNIYNIRVGLPFLINKTGYCSGTVSHTLETLHWNEKTPVASSVKALAAFQLTPWAGQSYNANGKPGLVALRYAKQGTTTSEYAVRTVGYGDLFGGHDILVKTDSIMSQKQFHEFLTWQSLNSDINQVQQIIYQQAKVVPSIGLTGSKKQNYGTGYYFLADLKAYSPTALSTSTVSAINNALNTALGGKFITCQNASGETVCSGQLSGPVSTSLDPKKFQGFSKPAASYPQPW